MTSRTSAHQRAVAGFRHEALLYDGEDRFVSAVAPFLEDALSAGDPTLVMVGPAKTRRLRAALGEAADRLRFADMATVGRNPARIIPAWRAFAARETGPRRRLRGVGEPIWPGRRAEELVECRQHEALLNWAFADAPPFWLVCPYDAKGLDPGVLEQAARTHPHIVAGDRRAASPRYDDQLAGLLREPLPDPPRACQRMRFDATGLRDVRALVSGHAMRATGDAGRAADFVLAVHESAANSVDHGGGQGVLRLWRDGGSLVCEVRDRGRIDEPLVGRHRPVPESGRGRGLWIVNHLCDLVQVRSSAAGTTVRMHLRAG